MIFLAALAILASWRLVVNIYAAAGVEGAAEVTLLVELLLVLRVDENLRLRVDVVLVVGLVRPSQIPLEN